MQPNVKQASPHSRYKRAVQMLCLSMLFAAALFCRPAQAQEQEKSEPSLPLYLSTMDALPGPYIKKGSATILNKRYPQSLSAGYNSTTLPTANLRYPVPAGYTRFKAWVGIDDTFDRPNWEFTFTVIGKNSDGKEIPLTPPISLSPGSKPREINISIKDIQILTLRFSTERNGLDEGAAWWGEPRLYKEDSPSLSPLKELADKLTKNLDAKSISLNRFILNPD